MTVDGLSERSQGTHPSARPRRYDSPRRRQQASETRAAIADAARRRFLEHGWSSTRVRDVARDAGVAESTVFAVYRNKAGLARALVDAVDLSAEVARSAEDVIAAAPGPAAQLALLIAADRRLFEHNGDLISLLRDAGRSEPELRAAYDDGRVRADAIRRAVFATWPRTAFRPGGDPASAATAFAALCNVEVYRILTAERGLQPDQVERWWNDSLGTLVLHPQIARPRGAVTDLSRG